MAFVFALIFTILVLPHFNSIADKKMTIPWSNPLFWLISIGFTVLTGMIAGLYPALFLSSFQPVKVLKGTFKAGRNASLPRKVLVIVQFTVSVILIIATITVFRQVQFAKSRPVGYSRQGLITIIMQTYNYHNNLANMRNDLLERGAITGIAESNTPVTENDHFNNGFSWQGMSTQVSAKFNTVNVTQGYGKTVGLEFINGRDFSNKV